MKSFFGWIIMLCLLVFAILDLLKLVEPRAPQPQPAANPYATRTTTTRRIITAVTPPIRVRPAAAAKIVAAVDKLEAAPVRQFRDYVPTEGIVLIFPGMDGGYIESSPEPEDTPAESRADQLKRESNERIKARAREIKMERQSNASGF